MLCERGFVGCVVVEKEELKVNYYYYKKTQFRKHRLYFVPMCP